MQPVAVRSAETKLQPHVEVNLPVGPIESQFFAVLREKLGLTDALFDRQNDKSAWPAMRARLATVFASKTRDEWGAVFDGSDGCVTPVLDLAEAPHHPHFEARQTFVDQAGMQPAPAPRFSCTPSSIQNTPALHATGVDAALQRWAFVAPSQPKDMK